MTVMPCEMAQLGLENLQETGSYGDGKQNRRSQGSADTCSTQDRSDESNMATGLEVGACGSTLTAPTS